MPRLMPAVETGSGEVAIHFALLQGYLLGLDRAAMALRTPRSELLRDFLAWGFQRFRREELISGMAFYRSLGGCRVRSARSSEGAPPWIVTLLEKRSDGERTAAVVLYVTRDQWKTLAQAVREVEREFLAASLSDVLTLFFAWGFAGYLASERGVRWEATPDDRA